MLSPLSSTARHLVSRIQLTASVHQVPSTAVRMRSISPTSRRSRNARRRPQPETSQGFTARPQPRTCRQQLKGRTANRNRSASVWLTPRSFTPVHPAMRSYLQWLAQIPPAPALFGDFHSSMGKMCIAPLTAKVYPPERRLPRGGRIDPTGESLVVSAIL